MVVFSISGSVLAETAKEPMTIAYFDVDEQPGLHNMPYREVVIQSAIQYALSLQNSKADAARFKVKYFRFSPDVESIKAKFAEMENDPSILMAVGPCADDVSLLSAPLFDQSRIVSISPYASTTDLENHSEYFWRYSDSTDVEAQALIQSLTELKLENKKVLIVYAMNHPYSKSISEYILKQLNGAESVGLLDDSDHLDEVETKIDQFKPDVIILPVYAVFAGKIIREMTNKGFNGIYLGGQSWGETNGRALDAITHGTKFIAYAVRAQSRYFLSDEAKQTYQKMSSPNQFDFTPLALTIFDTFTHIFNTIAQSKMSATRETVPEIFSDNMEFQGSFGKVCLNGSECTEREFHIIKFNGDGFNPMRSFRLRGEQL